LDEREPDATSPLDVTVTGCRQGDLVDAALASSTLMVKFDAAAWTNNTVRVKARNILPAAIFGLAKTTLSVVEAKRRFHEPDHDISSSGQCLRWRGPAAPVGTFEMAATNGRIPEPPDNCRLAAMGTARAPSPHPQERTRTAGAYRHDAVAQPQEQSPPCIDSATPQWW
jgi:hypothetical protein